MAARKDVNELLKTLPAADQEGVARITAAIQEPKTAEEIDALNDDETRLYAKHDLADPNLIAKIEEELPGVVNILAGAYERLVKRGGFTLPDVVKSSNERVLVHGNPLPMFLETQCMRDSKYRINVF